MNNISNIDDSKTIGQLELEKINKDMEDENPQTHLKTNKVDAYPNNMKRIPHDSIVLIFNFQSIEDRDAFIKSRTFQQLYGQMVVHCQGFNSKNVETLFNP